MQSNEVDQKGPLILPSEMGKRVALTFFSPFFLSSRLKSQFSRFFQQKTFDPSKPFTFIITMLKLTSKIRVATMAKSNNSQRFVVSCFFSLIFLCVLASINEIRFDSLLKFGQSAFSPSLDQELRDTNTSPPLSSPPSDDIRVLIGILTLPDHYHKRHFLRLIYGTQTVVGARVDVKFVFCNLTKEDQKVLVALEIMRYDDIIILNCQENMNKGKTYTYFSSLPEMLLNDTNVPYPPYHYVMKGDDDSYFRLQSLADSLRTLPRQDLYYGYVIPCPSMDPFVHYMSGMGYLVSWDIAEWLRDSEIPKKNIEGPEDKIFGEWLRDGHRGKNRYNAKWSMYNYPEPPTGCTHELWPDTIAVHLLKTQEKWIRTLNYFNVTHNLEPSKFYHIP